MVVTTQILYCSSLQLTHFNITFNRDPVESFRVYWSHFPPSHELVPTCANCLLLIPTKTYINKPDRRHIWLYIIEQRRKYLENSYRVSPMYQWKQKTQLLMIYAPTCICISSYTYLVTKSYCVLSFAETKSTIFISIWGISSRGLLRERFSHHRHTFIAYINWLHFALYLFILIKVYGITKTC